MLRNFWQHVVLVILSLLIPASLAADGSFTVSPSIAEVGAGITVTYALEDYSENKLYDIIAIYASGEVSNYIMRTCNLFVCLCILPLACLCTCPTKFGVSYCC